MNSFMRFRPKRHAKLAALTSVLAVGSQLLADPPAIYNLGTLDGGSIAHDVNASGQVVGTYMTASGATRGFVYTGTPGIDGQMLDLGLLPGGSQSRALSINSYGQIGGSACTKGGGNDHAFLYTGLPGSGGKMADLGTLGGNYSDGYAINDSGQMTGSSGIGLGGPTHPFLYSGIPGSGGAMADLGLLPGGTWGRGNAINATGQVVGFNYGSFGCHPFLYTGTPGNGGTMVDLVDPSWSGVSQANDINDSGQIVGITSTPVIFGSESIYHAWLYTGTPGVDGQMFDLGALGAYPEITLSEAEGINNKGQVVGYSYLTTGPYGASGAFLYIGTPGVDGQMIDLNAWLDAANPTEGARWTLAIACDLTDSGLIIGTGTYNDGVISETRAFLLDASSLTNVPEPGMHAFLIAGATGLLIRRRR